MSLPTIYRSSALSGQSAGWTTYKIDLSTYLGSGDYLQVGANSIYAGGNAHPTYNYASSKYYWVSDRMNIMFEDDAGNAWNITDDGQEGYYPYGSNDPAVTAGTHSYNGGTGGAPSWHCNYYGYNYGPNYQSWDGYYYYLYRYWLGQSVSYPAYYEAPDEFGFGWETSSASRQREPTSPATRTSTGVTTPQPTTSKVRSHHLKVPTVSPAPDQVNLVTLETHQAMLLVDTPTTTVFVLTTPTPTT